MRIEVCCWLVVEVEVEVVVRGFFRGWRARVVRICVTGGVLWILFGGSGFIVHARHYLQEFYIKTQLLLTLNSSTIDNIHFLQNLEPYPLYFPPYSPHSSSKKNTITNSTTLSNCFITNIFILILFLFSLLVGVTGDGLETV